MHRYDSFCYPQTGFEIIGSELKLSKIGHIRMKLHRPIKGKIKTCTIRRTPSGTWNVSISCEVEAKPLPVNERSVGIDVGIDYLLPSFQTAKKFRIRGFLKKDQKALAKAQNRLSKTEKGTKNSKTKRKSRCKNPRAHPKSPSRFLPSRVPKKNHRSVSIHLRRRSQHQKNDRRIFSSKKHYRRKLEAVSAIFDLALQSGRSAW